MNGSDGQNFIEPYISMKRELLGMEHLYYDTNGIFYTKDEIISGSEIYGGEYGHKKVFFLILNHGILMVSILVK